MPLVEKTIEAVCLLVVSREPSVLRPLWSIGESNGWHLETAGSAWDALDRVESGMVPHVLLLELPRGDRDNLHVLRWLRRSHPHLPIILLSHPDDAARKPEAIRLGAQDYLIRPFDEKQLELAIRQQLELSGDPIETNISSEDIEELADGALFVGTTPIMQKLRAQAKLLAQADVPVLILGESGSGKDTVAHLIHKVSVRSGCKFLKVNCAALPEDLLESELFGHDRNSSAAGARPKLGKLELCEKGTILLDEITEMPNRLQAKLLQLLQEKRFLRPSGEAEVSVDVRILAATSTNIERAVLEKKLREDLHYRLSAFTLHVPPLRQRREEIPLLMHHLMHHLAKLYGMAPLAYSPAVIEACQSYAWPGNFKELENFVKRYLIMGKKEWTFSLADSASHGNFDDHDRDVLNVHVRGGEDDSAAGTNPSSLKALVQSVKLEAERNAIAAALDKTGWNRKAAARLLGVSYRTLLYKIEQYHMRAPEAYSSSSENGLSGGKGWKTG
jgi:two-component system, NtrC family, response regulator AtoC